MADVNEIIKQATNTMDFTPEFRADDVEQNKVMAILAYLSWLVLIPIFFAPASKYARFHANQGLILAIVEIVVGFVLGLLGKLPLIGWIFGIVEMLFGLACFAMLVFGIYYAAIGRAKELPFIGSYRILK